MQYSTIFVSFLLSTVVAAQGTNRTLTETQTCKEMLKLNALVQLASNQTKVDAITGSMLYL